jgi:prepilin-type N-terminal cleavage/methylation domain-containing protein
MFIGVDRQRGFTLLEIIMAVAILATMALAIYRFVQSNLIAIRLSSETLASEARYDGLREVLAAQLQSLPSGKRGALVGDAFKLNDRERDEIRWICGAGPGLMTRYAACDFEVVLRLQSGKKDSDRLDLGFLRKPKDDSALTNANESWIPLIENVRSLQIRYSDARIYGSVWLDRWPSSDTLPRLVKLVVERTDSSTPWEVIIPLRRTPW